MGCQFKEMRFVTQVLVVYSLKSGAHIKGHSSSCAKLMCPFAKRVLLVFDWTEFIVACFKVDEGILEEICL
jgi:hypothetical protein